MARNPVLARLHKVAAGVTKLGVELQRGLASVDEELEEHKDRIEKLETTVATHGRLLRRLERKPRR